MVSGLVAPLAASKRMTSYVPKPPPGDRLPAFEWKATRPPSAEIDGQALSPPNAGSPRAVTDAMRVVPAVRSRKNTSMSVEPSPCTRSDALELNATYRPSALIDGCSDCGRPLMYWGSAPVEDTDAAVVVPDSRSRTKTSAPRLSSSGTRPSAKETNAT